MEQSTEAQIAAKLLEIEAVFLKPNEPFTWASGIISPIYCDNRLVLSYPEVRDMVIDGFVDLISTRYPEAQVIAGVATAGISHAALIADRMNLPMIYVRSKSKEHGRSNQIEGKLEAGSKVVVIEDLISTGGSSLKAVDALKDSGAEILGLAAIFTYQLDKAVENFKAAGVDYATLSNYSTLIDVALEKNLVQESDIEILKRWREQGSL